MKDWMVVPLACFSFILLICLISWIVAATTPSEEKLNDACGSDEYISFIDNGKNIMFIAVKLKQINSL